MINDLLELGQFESNGALVLHLYYQKRDKDHSFKSQQGVIQGIN